MKLLSLLSSPESVDELGTVQRVFQRPLCDPSVLLCAKNNNTNK